MTYDRLSSGDDKFIDWNARQLPERITVGDSASDATRTARDEFEYDPNGQRFYKRSTWQDEGTQRVEHTFYVGSFEELVTDPQDTVLNAVQKSRIGGSIVHIRTFPDSGSPVSRIEYLHRDHLGSVEAVTDDSGALVRTLAYDPYGSRRSGDWLGELDAAATETLADDLRESTTRGYTGHEQLDRTGFIHMNGRVYDPVLGRFLSPDPVVQNPAYSQSWNRYSYVMNSPMSFTDPTGYVRQGSICSTGLIMCMNAGGAGVGGSNASFSVPRTTQTIRTSGGTYSTWVPTGREFVTWGWTRNIFGERVKLGEYRETGFTETRYLGGALTSVETNDIEVNFNEGGGETNEPVSESHPDSPEKRAHQGPGADADADGERAAVYLSSSDPATVTINGETLVFDGSEPSSWRRIDVKPGEHGFSVVAGPGGSKEAGTVLRAGTLQLEAWEVAKFDVSNNHLRSVFNDVAGRHPNAPISVRPTERMRFDVRVGPFTVRKGFYSPDFGIIYE